MPSARNRRAASLDRESGFSVVELIVVMFIVLVLMTIALYSIGSARSSGRHMSAVAAAQSYADAADRFAREHKGRYPAAPGQSGPAGVDWEAGANAQKGPKSDVLGQLKYYLRGVPEAIQDGSVTFGAAGPARLDYQQTGGGSGYVIVVTIQGSTPCVINGGAANDPRRKCSSR